MPRFPAPTTEKFADVVSVHEFLRNQVRARQSAIMAKKPVLDVGSGYLDPRKAMSVTGSIYSYKTFLPDLLGGDYESLDPRKECGATWQETLEDFTFKHLKRYPTVLCFETMEHVSNPAEFAAYLALVCEPTARLFLTWPFYQAEHTPQTFYYATPDAVELVFKKWFDIDWENSKPFGDAPRMKTVWYEMVKR